MSKKKNKKVNNGEQQQQQQQKKNEANEEQKHDNQKVEEEDGEKKESNGGNAVVLKIDLHCEGCASKIVKVIRGFQGAESVRVDGGGGGGSGRITVTGKVDPGKLREKLEEKTHKKVELLSPVPKKDKDNAQSKNDVSGEDEKKKGPKDKNNSNNNNKKDEKNSKEPPVTTAVLKVALHCEGCIQKIHKIVTKTKGYQEMKVDKQKDLVTVKGSMDMKELAENLKKHLKKDVEIVPPKKDDKKGKGNGGGGGGGEDKGASGGGGGGDRGEKMEEIKMLQQQQQLQQMQFGGPFGYGYPGPSYPGPSPMVYGGPAYVGDPYQFHYHAPQMFSDENPNACSVM